MQILKPVMKIHTNYVLIDGIKKSTFSNRGGGGEAAQRMHV